MSALLAICSYSSDSEDSDRVNEKVKKHSRNKLPPPNLSKVCTVELSEDRIDDPEQHGGRVRSFPHVRGNWASYIYVTYCESQTVLDIINKITHLLSEIGTFKKCENNHISLSKTFVLKYHWIKTFVDELQTSIQNIQSFKLQFESVKVYCNEGRSRTFIALEVKQFCHKYLQEILKNIDNLLEAYNLPTFYKDPSFHMSILWIEGDKEEEITTIIDQILFVINSQTEEDALSIFVNKIDCNIGNKSYQFQLQL